MSLDDEKFVSNGKRGRDGTQKRAPYKPSKNSGIIFKHDLVLKGLAGSLWDLLEIS